MDACVRVYVCVCTACASHWTETEECAKLPSRVCVTNDGGAQRACLWCPEAALAEAAWPPAEAALRDEVLELPPEEARGSVNNMHTHKHTHAHTRTKRIQKHTSTHNTTDQTYVSHTHDTHSCIGAVRTPAVVAGRRLRVTARRGWEE